MEYAMNGSPYHNSVKQGGAGATAVQRMLASEYANRKAGQQNPNSHVARIEPRRRGRQCFEWPPRNRQQARAQPGDIIVDEVCPAVRQYFSPSQPANTKGLKKVTWPPPPDGDQDAVYAQEAPAENGFAPSPVPLYAEPQNVGIHHPQQRQFPPPHQQQQQQHHHQQPQHQRQTPQRRSASRDRSRASPAWTPPPTIITLRQSPPVHQEPAPVVVSQPATARMQANEHSQITPDCRGLQNGHYNRTDSSSGTSPIPPKPTRITAKNRGDLKWPPEDNQLIPETLNFEVPVAKNDVPIVKQSGVRARGDAKWPPPEYKTRAEEENQARVALAKGPVCRPRRPNKDYGNFFAQHALSQMYPGYRAPPGTQHYVDYSGVSDF